MTPDEMRVELKRRQLAARQAKVKSMSERGLGAKLYDNIIGSDDGVESPGERIGQTINDMGTSLGSGIVKGGAALLDMPGAIMSGAGDLAATGLRAVGAPEVMADQTSKALRQTPLGDGDLTGRGADLAIPGARDFQPQTTAGEYAQTVGEFLPGSVLGGGNLAGSAMRYGVLPGLASEAAGQATEGTKYEPMARIAAAIATPLLTGRPTNNARPILPTDPEDAKMAETLMRNGVRPTVGQVTGSDTLRRLEGSMDVLPGQADGVTAAAMTATGSTATRATPDALRQAAEEIGSVMDDAVAGVSFKPSAPMAQQADDVVKDYLRGTAQGSIVPDVRNIADEIMDAATNPSGGSLDLATLKDWRGRLGKLLQGSDPQAREAAFGLRAIIDDATQAELTAAGRVDDVKRLAGAREQYRNWLAIADASTRAGAENGILSPTQLNQSVIRSQGRRNVAIGNTTPMGELSRAAAGVLRPAATTMAGGARTITPQLMTALMGAGVGSALMPSNPVVASLIGAGLGAGAISGGQAIMRSRPVQSLMMDPQSRIMQALLAAPGALAGTK